MKRRWIVAAVIALPVLLVGALLVAVYTMPEERLGRMAAGQASRALGADVRIGGVGIDLLPTPAAALSEVSITSRTAEAGAQSPVATIQRVRLEPKLLPLFRGQVVIDEFSLEGPDIVVHIDSAGHSNLPTFPADTAPGPREPQGDIAFAIDRFELHDGELRWFDARDSTSVRLDGIEQRLSLSGTVERGELERIRLVGELAVAALSADMPERLAVPLDDLGFRLEHSGTLDRTADRLDLESFAVALGPVALEGAGRVTAVTDSAARAVQLELATGMLDLAEVERTMGEPITVELDSARSERVLPTGLASVRARISGPIGPDTLPAVEGSMRLQDVAVRFEGTERPLVSALTGNAVFSRDSVRIQPLRGRLLDEPLDFAVAVRDLARPAAAGELRTTLAFARLDELGLLPDSINLTGRVPIDVAFRIPTSAPDSARVTGGLALNQVGVQTPALLQPVALRSGRVRFEGDVASVSGLRATAGDSEVAIDAEATRWLPRVLGDTTTLPEVTFTARAGLLDADALLGADTTNSYSALLFERMAGAPRRGERAASAGEPPLPEPFPRPPLRATGEFTADRVIRAGIPLDNVRADIALGPDVIEIREARFGIFGGTANLAGSISVPPEDEGATAPASLRYRLEDVGAAPMFNRFTPFKNHLSGTMVLEGEVNAMVDDNRLPVRDNVSGGGTLALSNGRLANWPAVKRLAEELSLPRFDTLYFRDGTTGFSFTGSGIGLNEATVDGRRLDAQASGVVGYSGMLDLRATIRLEPELVGQIGGERGTRLATLAAGTNERVPIGVRIAGPARSPNIAIDLSEAAANASERARQEITRRTEQARDSAQARIRQELQERLPPRDSVPQLADSLRREAGDAVRSRLRGLFDNR